MNGEVPHKSETNEVSDDAKEDVSEKAATKVSTGEFGVSKETAEPKVGKGEEPAGEKKEAAVEKSPESEQAKKSESSEKKGDEGSEQGKEEESDKSKLKADDSGDGEESGGNGGNKMGTEGRDNGDDKDEKKNDKKEEPVELKTPINSAKKKMDEVVLSGERGKDWDLIDLGRQDVETSKIDTPESVDFEKRPQSEYEKYIQEGGLEGSDQYSPIRLVKVGDRYCALHGRHRVLLAKHMAMETVPARVQELKIFR